MEEIKKSSYPLPDGTVFSQRKNFTPFVSSPLESYTAILGEQRMERLYEVAARLKGTKILELNSSAQGGGVAEMLISAVPFLNLLGLDVEWKVIRGDKEYYESTKHMHNLLQGMPGSFTPEMEKIYLDNISKYANTDFIDYDPDVVTVHDPQPLGLTHYIKKPKEIWLWRCHIDMEDLSLGDNANLMNLVADWVEHCNAAIFSAAHYVVSLWPLPKFIIPPFIDPFSEKNRELTQLEITRVLDKYGIDTSVPIIAQIGRFDPWKGIDRTVATYREVRKEKYCQLIIAGGMATDDPEGARVLAKLYEDTREDEDVNILNLPLEDRLENWREINALQRAAGVIMQPSTKEGFGLVITEALWKGKPVIAADVGAIPLQIRDGETGYFYQNPQETAKRVVYFLDNPEAARVIGDMGKKYVKQHFLLPERIADYLMVVEMIMNGSLDKDNCSECIISYHPWFKQSKRR